jgi:anion-transporting  ArsA/GET3 family ATPase
MDTEASLREYLRLNLKLPTVGRIGPLARTFDFVADAAPGVKEILSVGKLTWEVKEAHYDLVVVDAPASGHVVSHLAAPEAIKDLVHVGLVRHQTEWMLDILSDPDQTGVVLVTTGEEVPVVEAVELARDIAAETPVSLAAVVANRVLPELFNRREEDLFDQLAAPAPARVLEEEAGDGIDAVLAAARLAVGLRRRAAVQLAVLREALPDQTVLYLPEQFGRAEGVALTERLATQLGEELG